MGTNEAHDKLYSRTGYRRVIAWADRIRREAPFLEGVTGGAPVRRFLDVGCGSGEHTRHFAEQGWQAVGIDVSEKMIEEARELEGPTPAGGSARFAVWPAARAAELPEAPFGAAICVGNTLAFVEGEESLTAFLAGVAGALAPGAPFLIQMLNYERITERPVRALPVNVRPLPEGDGEGEIIFLRVLDPRSDGHVDFYPITLTLHPGEEPRVEVKQVQHHVHQAWKRDRLEAALREAGFDGLRVLGGMSDAPYLARESTDLVIVSVRGPS